MFLHIKQIKRSSLLAGQNLLENLCLFEIHSKYFHSKFFDSLTVFEFEPFLEFLSSWSVS